MQVFSRCNTQTTGFGEPIEPRRPPCTLRLVARRDGLDCLSRSHPGARPDGIGTYRARLPHPTAHPGRPPPIALRLRLRSGARHNPADSGPRRPGTALAMSREGRSETPFVDFTAGSTILREGDAASALFIIEAGKVAIERSDAPGLVLAELGPGEFFGEMSILQEQPH